MSFPNNANFSNNTSFENGYHQVENVNHQEQIICLQQQYESMINLFLIQQKAIEQLQKQNLVIMRQNTSLLTQNFNLEKKCNLLYQKFQDLRLDELPDLNLLNTNQILFVKNISSIKEEIEQLKQNQRN